MSVAYHVVCCPPYPSVDTSGVETTARRTPVRKASPVIDSVNQASPFTDNMWCRPRGDTTVTGVSSRAVRD